MDHLNSNGTSLARIRKSSRSGANSSPPSTSSRRQSLEQRVKEVATLHKDLSTHSMGASKGGPELDREQAETTSPLHTTLENNNDSWANSLRKPLASKSRAGLTRKQFRENVIQNLWDSMPCSLQENPDLKYRDFAPQTKTQKHAGQRELTSKYGDPGVDQRPSTSNGRPRQNFQDTDIPGVNERGSRRPSSASRSEDPSAPSNLEVDKSPAPSGRQRMVDSRNELSTSTTSRRALRSESMPHRTSVDSRIAAVKENGHHASNGQSRSSSASRRENLTIPSNREGDISPAPDRRQKISDSRNELSIPAASRGALRSESMPHRRSRVVDSRTAALKENGFHSTSSASRRENLTIPSNREGDISPAPDRRQKISDSRNELSTPAASRGALRSESMPHRTSRVVDSRTAAVKENGFHSTSSASRRENLTIPSNCDGNTSAAPDRRQRISDSHDELSTPAASRGALRSESMPRRTSRVVDSRTAAVKENGFHSTSSASRRENLTIPSNCDGDTSAAPDRRQRISDSHDELITPAASRGALRSESMPRRVVDPRKAAVNENDYHGSSSASSREDLRIPSNREWHISPAPTRRQRIPDSRSEVSTAAMARGKLRSESIPHIIINVVDTRTAAVKENHKHSSNSASIKVEDVTNRSHRGREPSPVSIHLRRSTSGSLNRLSTSPTSSKTKRRESMRHQSPSGVESRTAVRSESMSHQRSGGEDARTAARSESMRYQRSSGMDSRIAASTENGSRRSTTDSKGDYLTNPSNRDKEPAPIRHPYSRAEMIEFFTSSRKISKNSESHSSRRSSSSRGSRTGARVYVPSQVGHSTNLHSRKEAVSLLVRAKSGSIDDYHSGETLESDECNKPISLRIQCQGIARSCSTGESKAEPSTSARMRARLAAGTNGNLKDENDDAATADFQNLHATELGTSRRSRQERESDYKPGTRQRSITRDKSLKEIENSPADSEREGRTNRLTSVSKRLYSRKYPATNSCLDMPLNKVAAASYSGGSLPFDEMVPFPEDIANLNKFLGDCRRDVEARVPGKILIAVIGQENSDLDSIVSTIAFAYFLSCRGKDELRYYAPVINIREENFVLHTDAIWLFKASGVDTSNLIFVDQISLLYYHKFGCLSLVLVDHSKLAPHQEELQDAVISIIDHNVPESVYPWVPNVEIEQVGSCCTLIAEKYASEAPEHLTGRGISRLLLGAIILDTANLDGKFSRFTTRDEVMAAFLIHGAGRYGLQGLFRHLRKMRYDISKLCTKDVLRKDFKPWTLGPGKTDVHGKGTLIPAAMSTIGVPLVGFLSRTDIVHDLKCFRKGMNLELLMIMTGYYDVYDRYHREILVVAKDIELARQIVTCFSEHKDGLRLSSLRMDGLPEEMLVYKQGQVTASRKMIIEILLNHFAQ